MITPHPLPRCPPIGASRGSRSHVTRPPSTVTEHRWCGVPAGAAQSEVVGAPFEAVEDGRVDHAARRVTCSYPGVLTRPRLVAAADLDLRAVHAGGADDDGRPDVAADVEHDRHGTTEAGVLDGFDQPL